MNHHEIWLGNGYPNDYHGHASCCLYSGRTGRYRCETLLQQVILEELSVSNAKHGIGAMRHKL